jgi:vacuolar-type H+-ATPase subunit E/Vma4
MSITNLKLEIQRNAEFEAVKIIQKAQEEATQVVNLQRDEIEENRKSRLRDRIEDIKRRERTELSTTHIDQRTKFLKARDELFRQVLIEAEKRLEIVAENKDPQYLRFLHNAILEGARKLSGNKLVILANNRDKKILKKELESIQKEISKIKGSQTELTLSPEDIKTKGGIILHTQDLHQYYNNTLEASLNRFREERIAELADILLKEG